MDANVLQHDEDQNVRERFGVTRDGDNLVVRHRLRIIAKQFPTARDRDRFRLLVRTIGYVHGAPPFERESRRFVLDGLRALARRFVIDAPMSV
jgi:hypothetical protein